MFLFPWRNISFRNCSGTSPCQAPGSVSKVPAVRRGETEVLKVSRWEEIGHSCAAVRKPKAVLVSHWLLQLLSPLAPHFRHELKLCPQYTFSEKRGSKRACPTNVSQWKGTEKGDLLIRKSSKPKATSQRWFLHSRREALLSRLLSASYVQHGVQMI